MLLFIDTEFCRFNCPLSELISLACVTEDNRCWYGVNTLFPKSASSEFVLEHVLPYIDHHEPTESGSLSRLACMLSLWIDVLTDYDEVQVVVDYVGDWDLISELLSFHGVWPRRLKSRPAYLLFGDESPAKFDEVKAFSKAFMRQNNLVAHNALSDAMTNKAIWEKWCATK